MWRCQDRDPFHADPLGAGTCRGGTASIWRVGDSAMAMGSCTRGCSGRRGCGRMLRGQKQVHRRRALRRVEAGRGLDSGRIQQVDHREGGARDRRGGFHRLPLCACIEKSRRWRHRCRQLLRLLPDEPQAEKGRALDERGHLYIRGRYQREELSQPYPQRVQGHAHPRPCRPGWGSLRRQGSGLVRRIQRVGLRSALGGRPILQPHAPHRLRVVQFRLWSEHQVALC
mmetsp:Transcript_59015/g.164899  ORF Transcript_59015/g.164899 Transcript_59015/m.164899 type:complete len:227 (+) Transcript_59015:163-843(+)